MVHPRALEIQHRMIYAQITNLQVFHSSWHANTNHRPAPSLDVMWARKPYHWTSVNASEPQLIPVKFGTDEGAAILSYFLEGMPEHTELERIERYENDLQFMPYSAYKQTVVNSLPDWSTEQVESWLFHGTDAVQEVLNSGFNSSCANLRHNKYGSGSYFARDPRLAHYFVRGARSSSTRTFKLILARVVLPCRSALPW